MAFAGIIKLPLLFHWSFSLQEVLRELRVWEGKYLLMAPPGPRSLFKMNVKRLINLTLRFHFNMPKFWFWQGVTHWILQSVWAVFHIQWVQMLDGCFSKTSWHPKSKGPWVPTFLVEAPLQRPLGNAVILQNGAYSTCWERGLSCWQHLSSSWKGGSSWALVIG